VKVAIVGGAGGVGASVGFNLLLGLGSHEIVLVDSRPAMINSHVWDLEQVMELTGRSTIRGGDATADLADANVVVVTAAAPLTVNTSRMVYLADNARVVAGVVDQLPPTWDGVLLVVTNPVDPLCTWVLPRTSLDRGRVLGYTLNDSLRVRTGIGRVLGKPAGSVDAWALGEHGDKSVFLLDRVAVDGEPVELTREQQDEATDFVRNWYVRHVALDSGRSSTWTSGVGVARMVDAIGAGSGDDLWPASVLLQGEYGIDGVALSVPVTLGPAGAEQIHEWELTPEQQAALNDGADFVRAAAGQIEI
jgi:malate/lactate dehydrogenase